MTSAAQPGGGASDWLVPDLVTVAILLSVSRTSPSKKKPVRDDCRNRAVGSRAQRGISRQCNFQFLEGTTDVGSAVCAFKFNKLGVVEVIHANPTNDTDIKHHQTFQFLIVIDFESTCWEENINGSQPEIIEFPAVLLNLKTGIIEEEFQQYVLPVENSKLSKFCMQLTGIKQEDVDNGVPLQTCLSLFSKWINKISTEKKFTFPHNLSETKDKCAFVTWSDWDFRVCLHNECQRKQIYKPEYFTQWIDLRATYKTFYKRWPQGLKGALSELGLSFEGREHSGLCDARNTAHLAWKMIQDGVALHLTSSLPKQKSMVKQQKCSSNELLMTRSLKSHRRVPLKQINNSVTRKIAAKKTMEQATINNTSCIKTHTPAGNLKTLRSVSTPKINILQSKQSKHFTPEQLIRTAPHSSAKRTPPFCKCGRRAACKTASLPGPNQGRIFFSCPKRRSLGMVQMSGCSFFCWAS